MSIKTFKRYEYKYALTKQQYQAVIKAIEPYVNVDPYCIDGKRYKLYNMYFDTEDYSVIRHSVSKPKFKEKLRLRSYYPELAPDDSVFVELKKKCSGCVNKRRAVMKYKDAVNFLKTGKAAKNGDYIHDQVISEIEGYLKKYPVCHTTYLSYSRQAFFVKTDKKIRITFDNEIYASRVSFEDRRCRLLDEDMYLMEIKLSHYMPLWLVKILSENKVYRHGFSKYGTFYKKYIIPERKEKI